MRLSISLAALIAFGVASPAFAGRLVQPTLHIQPGGPAGKHIALTLDACDGHTDQRILSALVDNRIPATIFITAKWLKRNSAAFATLRAHPDLFQLEDHGARHVPAVDEPVKVYGISAAGSPEAVRAEVEGGAAALVAAGAAQPKWFRGATAKYTPTSLALIRGMGFKVAGFSVNADGGSLLGAATTQRNLEAAKDGDVVIAHINQPTHAAGAGLVKGLLDLKARGVTFVRLDDGGDVEGDAATN